MLKRVFWIKSKDFTFLRILRDFSSIINWNDNSREIETEGSKRDEEMRVGGIGRSGKANNKGDDEIYDYWLQQLPALKLHNVLSQDSMKQKYVKQLYFQIPKMNHTQTALAAHTLYSHKIVDSKDVNQNNVMEVTELLTSRILQIKHTFKPKEISIIMHAYSKLNIKDNNLIQQLKGIILHSIEEYDRPTLISILGSLSRWNIHTNDSIQIIEKVLVESQTNSTSALTLNLSTLSFITKAYSKITAPTHTLPIQMGGKKKFVPQPNVNMRKDIDFDTDAHWENVDLEASASPSEPFIAEPRIDVPATLERCLAHAFLALEHQITPAALSSFAHFFGRVEVKDKSLLNSYCDLLAKGNHRFSLDQAASISLALALNGFRELSSIQTAAAQHDAHSPEQVLSLLDHLISTNGFIITKAVTQLERDILQSARPQDNQEAASLMYEHITKLMRSLGTLHMTLFSPSYFQSLSAPSDASRPHLTRVQEFVSHSFTIHRAYRFSKILEHNDYAAIQKAPLRSLLPILWCFKRVNVRRESLANACFDRLSRHATTLKPSDVKLLRQMRNFDYTHPFLLSLFNTPSPS